MSDLISRQAVIDTIETDCSWDIFNEWGSRTPTGECIINAIKSVPSVEPERKTGKWIRGEAYPHRIYCSECYKTFIPNDEMRAWVDGDLPRKYCPECGARMEVDG